MNSIFYCTILNWWILLAVSSHTVGRALIIVLSFLWPASSNHNISPDQFINNCISVFLLSLAVSYSFCFSVSQLSELISIIFSFLFQNIQCNQMKEVIQFYRLLTMFYFHLINLWSCWQPSSGSSRRLSPTSL